MENFDIIVISLILILGLKGLLNGFIREFFGLVGIIGGIFIGSRFSNEVGKLINDNIFTFQNENAITLVGFLASVFIFWILMVILSGIINKLIDNSDGLSILNRLLGLLAGTGKILLIISVIVYAFSSIELVKKNINKHIENSIVYPYLLTIGSSIIKLDLTSKEKVEENLSETTEKIKDMVTKDIEKIKETK